MNVCFAVQRNEGINSLVYNHFGSAPEFIIVDTELHNTIGIDNKDLHHTHGACNPIMAVGGFDIDAVVVGGIGAGALTKLNAQGVKVYGSVAKTVKENLDLLKENRLPELSLQHACGGHQGGCQH